MATEAIITWPGIGRVLSFHYEVAVGISPQVALLECVPELSAPALTGTLKFGVRPTGEGENSLTLVDCHVAQNGFRSVSGPGGTVWYLSIMDRRWRWLIGPGVFGEYNQRDRRGKIVPWTARSPYQLARILLEAMGEVGYTIDLPFGLASEEFGAPEKATGDFLLDPAADYLNIGQNVPQSGTNPPTSWTGIPAAVALAQLCDQYGRVVVWDPNTDKVSVQQLGTGAAPATEPENSPALALSPSVDPKSIPSAIRIEGAPIRFQARFKFRAVAQEWDGKWLPPEEVSYAPTIPATDAMMVVFSNTGPFNLTIDGHEFGFDNPTGHAAAINAGVFGFIAWVTDGLLVVNANSPEHVLKVKVIGATEVACVHGPVPLPREPGGPIRGFAKSDVPHHTYAAATTRLNYHQARQLAQATVWSCYQLVCVDPHDETSKYIRIAGVTEPIDNRYRVVLLGTRPEQIEPRPGDENRLDPNTGKNYAHEIYQGFSKDRAPATYGSLNQFIMSGGYWTKAAADKMQMTNTQPQVEFYVPFTMVDPERQVISFAQPIYRVFGGETAFPTAGPVPAALAAGAKASVVEADVVVETGCYVLDPVTNAPYRYSYTLTVPGGLGPVLTVVKEDVQKEIVGEYDATHKIVGTKEVDGDAESRADYYARAIAATYTRPNSFNVTYDRFHVLSLSGVTRQVGWSLSRGGFVTTAAANSEPSTVVVSYPERRRRENLPADMVQGVREWVSVPQNRSLVEKYSDTAAKTLSSLLGGGT